METATNRLHSVRAGKARARGIINEDLEGLAARTEAANDLLKRAAALPVGSAERDVLESRAKIELDSIEQQQQALISAQARAT